MARVIPTGTRMVGEVTGGSLGYAASRLPPWTILPGAATVGTGLGSGLGRGMAGLVSGESPRQALAAGLSAGTRTAATVGAFGVAGRAPRALKSFVMRVPPTPSAAELLAYTPAQQARALPAVRTASMQAQVEAAKRAGGLALAPLEAKAAQLEASLPEVAFREAKEIQSTFPRTMQKISQAFRARIDKGLALSKDVQVTKDEATEAVQQYLSRHPEIANPQQFLDDSLTAMRLRAKVTTLGRAEDVLEMSTGRELNPRLLEAVAQARGEGTLSTTSLPEIMQGLRAIRQQIPTLAKAGRQLYTEHDLRADDLAQSLMEVIKAKAPPAAVREFTRANGLWSRWAPVRDRAFREYDPFIRSPIGLKPGMASLEQAAQGEPTASAFIRRIERYGRHPRGGLTAPLHAVRAQQSRVAQQMAGERASQENLLQALGRRHTEAKDLAEKLTKRRALLGKIAKYGGWGVGGFLTGRALEEAILQGLRRE